MTLEIRMELEYVQVWLSDNVMHCVNGNLPAHDNSLYPELRDTVTILMIHCHKIRLLYMKVVIAMYSGLLYLL